MALRRMVGPAFLVGFGLAFLADLAVFHVLLDWHATVSALTADPGTNLLADVALGVVALVLLAVGVLSLGARRRAGDRRRVVGSGLLGFGAANVVDSVVNHWLLGAHHIYPPAPLLGDVAFFVVALAFLAAGATLLGMEEARPAPVRGEGRSV